MGADCREFGDADAEELEGPCEDQKPSDSFTEGSDEDLRFTFLGISSLDPLAAGRTGHGFRRGFLGYASFM